MLNININKLSQLELSVHNKITEILKQNNNLKILEAAQLGNVSSSQISKYVRKLGFENFKQYKQHFGGQQIVPPSITKSTELERLQKIIENFNPVLIDNFLKIYNKYNKIVLYGLGPSFICAQYFSYKLALVSEKSIYVSQSETYTKNLVDKDTLLIVFSVTGKFASFNDLFHSIKPSGTEIMLILEEYDNSLALALDIDNIFYLTKYTQSNDLLAFEKTRTVFFIFIEEVISRLMAGRNAATEVHLSSGHKEGQ
ncbi:MurR/RpiR family transcriptional regulator [Paenibacillus sp. MAHUQ-46]|uniref:MurR/RpiR family transcriptional regulator n=1 Tax=Paenibacillus roseus TaxID=2798579 RepID=A0A934J546_9BACL|nr:SIS domain-containing protein [Paenibacillus roseus]MBJ6361713.1 MurR/RpiR family transcriptional regulator [Paenibacillus roseus]